MKRDACPGGNLGAISFDIQNDIVISNFPNATGYEITWDDIDDPNITARDDLYPGQYNVSIENICGELGQNI